MRENEKTRKTIVTKQKGNILTKSSWSHSFLVFLLSRFVYIVCCESIRDAVKKVIPKLKYASHSGFSSPPFTLLNISTLLNMIKSWRESWGTLPHCILGPFIHRLISSRESTGANRATTWKYPQLLLEGLQIILPHSAYLEFPLDWKAGNSLLMRRATEWQ